MGINDAVSELETIKAIRAWADQGKHRMSEIRWYSKRSDHAAAGVVFVALHDRRGYYQGSGKSLSDAFIEALAGLQSHKAATGKGRWLKTQ